jgi:iron complex outermembrane receptor protein
MVVVQIAKSQNCNFVFKGCINDALNSEHLDFASLTILELNKSTETDEHGEFEFDGICAGSYRLKVKHIGCKDTVFSFKVPSTKRVVFKIPHSEINLGEIDVMDKRIEMKSTQTENKLTNEELEKGKGQNLGDILKNVSGMTTLNSGGTINKPMLHGMQGYRLLIVNNGVRQEGQNWGNEHAPEIDPFIAKRISVIKGANAIRYGSDAIAGVVLVEANELPDTIGTIGEVNLVGLSNGRTGAANAMFEGNFEKIKGFSWRIQGSLKQGGNIKTPNYYLTNTGINEYNYSYGLGYHRKKWGIEVYYSQFNTEIGIFRGAHIGNLTDLQNAIERGKPADSNAVFSYKIDRPNQKVAHELIKGLAHYHLASKWRAKLQYAWQYNARKEFDLRRLTNEERTTGIIYPDLDLYITSQTGDFVLEHDNINSLRGQFGLSGMYQENVYQGRFFVPNFINKTIGAFATERLVKPHHEFEAGLRYDYKNLQSFFYNLNNVWSNELLQFSNLTYNTGYIYKPNQKFNLFVNAGSAWRAPAPNELYSNGIHQGLASIVVGNNQLKTEKCLNITSTAILRLKRLNMEVSVYTNEFKNFTFLNPGKEYQLTVRGAFPVFYHTQANANISGLDLKSEINISKYFSTSLKAMFVRGWNRSINDYLMWMPSDRGELTLNISLPESKFLKKSKFIIQNQYVTKQWRVPTNTDFASPPNAYYLLGLEIASNVTFQKQEIKLSFSTTNLLNQQYREFLDRFRYFADAAGTSYNLRISIPFIIHQKNNQK